MVVSFQDSPAVLTSQDSKPSVVSFHVLSELVCMTNRL